MKAVVLETKDGYCAVLKDDGTLEKIKMTAEVGQEIDLAVVSKKARKVRRFSWRYAAMAASVAFVAVASGYLSFIQDYSFVSMDVDASVEYALNRMDRVVHVNAFDEKGEKLAESVMKEGVGGNTLDEAVNKTADVLQRDGYVEKSDDVVLVSVSSKSKKKSRRLKDRVKKTLDKEEMTASVEDVSLEEREAAKESGLSTPRYAVVKEIIGDEPIDQAAIEVANAKSAGELLTMAQDTEEKVSVDDPEKGDDEATTAKIREKEVCEEIEDEEELEEVVQEDEDSLSEDEKDVESQDTDAEEEEVIEDDVDEESKDVTPEVSSEEMKPSDSVSPSTIPVEEIQESDETAEESGKKNLIQEVVEPIEKVLTDIGSSNGQP